MICFECKETHENRKPKQPGTTTAQLTECDYCGREDVLCFPDYKVLKEANNGK